MERYRLRTRPDNLISAEELASFVYCPEQWRLEKALGLEPVNEAELKAGRKHHRRKAAAEHIAGGSIQLGTRLLLVAVALVAAALLMLLVWR